MARWIFYLVVVVALSVGCIHAYRRVMDEKLCYDTLKCDDRLHSLETQLEFYSSDQVLAAEKASGARSKRRAFYPPDLPSLASAEKGSDEFFTCPIYGVPYRYSANSEGTSFFAYCPARHRFHFDARPFVNAIVPEAVSLHLFVEGGRVMNLEGGHPNPWDFRTPERRPPGAATGGIAEVVSPVAPSAFQMLPQNPPAVRFW